MAVHDILSTVASYSPAYITVTGGEPLAQKGCLALLQALCEAGYEVSLETSGALDIADVDPRVSIVMDLKTPGSGEQERNLPGNIPLLRRKDQVKFVICDRNDYDWSVGMISKHALDERVEILFSPAHGELNAAELAQWILNDRLRVRFQVQLHKLLWKDEPGR
jgi:7-carboxy-7-deazaguanine synthase